VNALGTQLLHQVLHALFLTYATLVMAHFGLQVVFAHIAFARAQRERELRPVAPDAKPTEWPSVDVIITSYNEDPATLGGCLSALAEQDYPGDVKVWVVDDASPNRAQLDPIYAACVQRFGWNVLLAPVNRGKRRAQDAAFRRSTGEIVVTIDSDTQVDPDGISELVAALREPRVGAVTGDVGVTNWRTNLLTRLIGMRYWVAFNQERAAQGFFRTVLCCSGPLAAYRRNVLHGVWSRYIEQTYRGIECTYGDDRHLTNLVLSAGYDTAFAPFAHAITEAPETLSGYLRQQLRWNKSFYRELLWTLPFLLTRPLYMVFEVLVQALLPLLLTVAVFSALAVTVIDNPLHLFHYAAVVMLMALLRCSYAIYRTRRLSFALFVAYGFLHLALLIPTRIRALLTLSDNRWGTRTVTPPAKSVDGAVS
jgi:hyaluronan synthase/N-acetylglucosaminyltransferase